MTDDPQIDLAEKERRRREAEWLALMLLLIGDTRRDAVRAAKIGRNALTVARGVFLGHPDTADEGAAPVIAEQMAHAEIEGARRAYRMAGLKPPKIDQATFDRIAAGNAAEAQTVADLTWGVIESKLAPALRGAAGQGIGETVKAIRLAFNEAGVTKSDPSTLEKGAERQVVEKHNRGLWRGARTIIDPKHHLVGFEFVAVLDSSTTTICRSRSGLRLPPDHPYWRTNFPSLHWGCRSVLAPLFGSTLTGESKSLPTEPPAPGFGFAPSAELGSYFGIVRRGSNA